MPISEAELKKLVSQISRVPAEKIRPESAFRVELRMDSLAALDLLTALEEDHGVNISQEQARGLTTYGQLLEFIKSRG